jgi:hypothetical protein
MDHLPGLSLLTSSEGVCRFLELPREIRDMIYDYIWTAVGAIKLCNGNRIYTITYRTSHWKSARGLRILGGSSKWLMTNKQIMEEGLLQLRRHAVWHINDRFVPLEEPDHIASILLPSSVVCLNAEEELFCKNFQSNARYTFRDLWRHIPIILATHFKDTQAKTFVLKLRNKMRGHLCASYPPSPSFDLSLLQQLTSCSQLERLCVQVETLITPHHSLDLDFDYLLHWEKPCIQALTKAVAKMGRRVIKGGRETMTDMEGYWAEFREVYESEKRQPVLFWRYIIKRA